MSILFDGFRPSDFSAFEEEKQKNPRFNDERKIVWNKIRILRSCLDIELKRREFPLEGQVSLYWINYVKRHVNGIWLAYTDIKPYYIVCQLNCGIYKDGFFAGIEINPKAISHLDNVASFIKNNKDEFLSYVKKLDPNYVWVDYGKWHTDPKKISVSSLDGLTDALNRERSWFEIGEWYPKKESFLTTEEIVSRIPDVFELLLPLYFIFTGRQPPHQPKISYELNEDDISREVKKFSKGLSTGKVEEKIDLIEEFKKLKPESSPSDIQTQDQVRVQYIVTVPRQLIYERKYSRTSRSTSQKVQMRVLKT